MQKCQHVGKFRDVGRKEAPIISVTSLSVRQIKTCRYSIIHNIFHNMLEKLTLLTLIEVFLF
jgi:hypothetical protein